MQAEPSAAMGAAAIFLALFFWLGVCGGVTGMVGKARGHSFWLFFIIGALVSPLLGIILAFVITPSGQGRRRRSSARRGTQRVERGTGRAPAGAGAGRAGAGTARAAAGGATRAVRRGSGGRGGRRSAARGA